MGNIPAVATGQKATAAQYNALQSALNPLVENNYTSWALITDVAGNPNSFTHGAYAMWISIDDANGIIYFYDNENFALWSCNIDGSNLNVLSTSVAWIGGAELQTYPIGPRPASIRSLYLVATNGGGSPPQFGIFSKGQLVQTVTINNMVGGTVAVAISPTGRYIVAVGEDSVTSGNTRVQVYEGQP